MNRKLIALETFVYPYGSKVLRPGDRFEAVSDSDAEGLKLARRAKDDDEAAIEEAKPKRGTYKRRDMTAESTK